MFAVIMRVMVMLCVKSLMVLCVPSLVFTIVCLINLYVIMISLI